MQSKTIVIAIDGPAASGKGTLARLIARHYGLRYLDTGELYRAVAKAVLDAGADPHDPEETSRISQNLQLETINPEGLRSVEVTRAAALVASEPKVRSAILHIQRDFAHASPGAVLDGRDIGTVVCPDADVKLFITASPEVRAHRRWLELNNSGSDLTEAQVLADVRDRDRRDAERASSPMKPADDAHLLDTSNLSIETAFDAAVAIIDGSMS